MIKLYKRIDNELWYHEAWISGMQIIEHKGKVGTNGEAYSFDYTSGQPDELSLEKVLKQARTEGFSAIDDEAHFKLSLIYEYETKPNQIDKILDELEDIVDEVLGWQGLGGIKNKQLTTTTAALSCLVVDLKTATNRISEVLIEPRYQGFRLLKG